MPSSRNLAWSGRIWWVLTIAGSATIAALPARAQNVSFEQASAVFVQRYIEEWSGQNSTALAFMDQIYPNQVYFYGKNLSHAGLMSLKRKFALRWPERTLSIRPDSIRVVCDQSHICAVEAIYDWHYRSPERQAVSKGSATLKLELQGGMTILSEDGSVIPSNGSAPAISQVHQQPVSPQARPPREPSSMPPSVTTISPRPEDINPGWDQTNPAPDDIVALRNTYAVHATDTGWIAAWLAQKREFSGQAVVVDATEDHAAPGPAGELRTVDFASAAGTVACVNPDDATSLKVGEKVNLHGVITIFIEDVMYLGQCSIHPG